jgi:hypothetical protein
VEITAQDPENTLLQQWTEADPVHSEVSSPRPSDGHLWVELRNMWTQNHTVTWENYGFSTIHTPYYLYC